MYDVIVIGAGVCGSLIARECEKYRMSLCVLEKEADVAMGTTKANSAIVHAGFDAKPGTQKAKLNVLGSEQMEDLCKDLGVKYKRNGALVVGFSEEDKATLEELLLRGKTNGVKEMALKPVSEYPCLGDGVTCVLSAPTSAIVCPYELCIAAMGNAMENGAELRRSTEVTAIKKTKAGYRVSVRNSESGKSDTLEARVLVNAAGVHSGIIAKMIGDDSFTITPRRGEYLLLDKECGALTPHTVFRCPSKMGKGILVTPTVDGNLLIGPTAEDQEDFESAPTTQDGLSGVRQKSSEQVKGIDFSKVITSFAGLRAVGSTGDFIIGPAKGNEDFLNVAAIESPGLSASPAIAKEVADMVRSCLAAKGVIVPAKEIREEEKPAGADTENIFFARRKAGHWFHMLSPEEKNAVIQKNPAYGHMICRCEEITEGEIIEAIHREPAATDLDGIKRRTRAGMGRCQGGFCAPLVWEILARERQVDPLTVTKFGGQSTINIKKTKEVR